MNRYGWFILAGILFSSPLSAADEGIPEKTVEALKAATVYVKVEGKQGITTGSGFLIHVDGETGLVATNRHVVLARNSWPLHTKAILAGLLEWHPKRAGSVGPGHRDGSRAGSGDSQGDCQKPSRSAGSFTDQTARNDDNLHSRLPAGQFSCVEPGKSERNHRQGNHRQSPRRQPRQAESHFKKSIAK